MAQEMYYNVCISEFLIFTHHLETRSTFLRSLSSAQTGDHDCSSTAKSGVTLLPTMGLATTFCSKVRLREGLQSLKSTLQARALNYEGVSVVFPPHPIPQCRPASPPQPRQQILALEKRVLEMPSEYRTVAVSEDPIIRRNL
jgi:hypothetical protein